MVTIRKCKRNNNREEIKVKKGFLILAILLIAGLLLPLCACAEAWPPEGKEEGAAAAANAMSGTYIYNYENQTPIGTAWDTYLYPAGSREDSVREPATMVRLTQISGDSRLKDAFSAKYYDDGTFDEDGYYITYNPDAVKEDGEAAYRAEFESEHYWAVIEFSAQFYDFSRITIAPLAETIDCVVGEKVETGWNRADRFFIVSPDIQPNYEYFFSPETGEAEAETDGYILSWSGFVAKEPGDYPLDMWIWLGRNEIKSGRISVTMHAISREDAEKAWDAAWPPEGKTEAASVTTSSASDMSGTYFINGGRGGLTLGTYSLTGEDGTRETVSEYHPVFLSGDEALRGLFSISDGYSDGSVRLRVNFDTLTEPGTAEFRIDMASEHYWASVTARPVIADANATGVELVSADVNVPIGETVSLGRLYDTREYVLLDPKYEYRCDVVGTDGEPDTETDDYQLSSWGEFTAKKAGDYPLTLRVMPGSFGMTKEFTITVHASEGTETAAVVSDTEAPLTMKAIREAEEERKERLERLKAEKGPDEYIAETEEAVFMYKLEEGQAELTAIAALAETVTVPSSLDGHPLTAIGYRISRSGESVHTLILSEGIRSVGKSAFLDFRGLKRLVLPESLDTIGDYAFQANSLDEIVLPSGLKTENIGHKAFGEVGTDCLVLSDGTDLMKVSYDLFRAEGSSAWGMPMTAEQDGFEYLLREDGGAVILNIAYNALQEDGTRLTVPENLNGHPVREIAEYACGRREDLQALELPEGLEVIGERAFFSCSSLTQVRIPSTVTEIGSKAFAGVGADQIRLPENIASLASDWFSGPETWDASGKWAYQLLSDGTAAITAFRYSAKLVFPSEVDGFPVSEIRKMTSDYDGMYEARKKVTQITLPDSVRVIEAEAFSGLSKLASVKLPAGLERIEAGLFAYCGLKSVKIPETVTYIGESAFVQNDLTSVKLPARLKTIGSRAFAQNKLTGIAFPEGLEEIGEEAFYQNKISGKITFPESLLKIGTRAFGNNEKIKGAVFKNPNMELPQNVLIALYRNETPYDPYYEGSENDSSAYNTLTIQCYPGSTADRMYRFYVKKTYLKWGPEHIRTTPAETVLHAGCVRAEDNIYELVIPEGVEEIAEDAFADLGTLYQVTFPESLKKIGDRAFSGCASLTKIVFPKKWNLESLGSGAFKNCDFLQSFILSEKITEIGDETFAGCRSLSKLDQRKAPLKRIGNSAFDHCASLTDFALPAGLESIGDHAFAGTGLKKVTVPDTVRAVGSYAFEDTELTGLTLPDGITEIPEGLCLNCVSLKSFTVPKGVTVIGDQAFAYCRSLASVTIPEGVVRIGENAFFQNVSAAQYYYSMSKGTKTFTALRSLKLPASLETIGKQAFVACDALGTVTFAKGSQLKEIGESAFAVCVSLKEILLPDTTETLGSDAFVNCLRLKKADLGKAIREIGAEAFMYDTELNSLIVPDTLTSIGDKALEGHGKKLTVTCPEGSAMEAWLKENAPEVSVTHPKNRK